MKILNRLDEDQLDQLDEWAIKLSIAFLTAGSLGVGIVMINASNVDQADDTQNACKRYYVENTGWVTTHAAQNSSGNYVFRNPNKHRCVLPAIAPS